MSQVGTGDAARGFNHICRMIYFFNTAMAYFAISGCLYLSQTGCTELKCEATRKQPSKLHLIISAILGAIAALTSFYTLVIRRSLVQAYFDDFFYNSSGEKTFMKRMIFRDKFIVRAADGRRRCRTTTTPTTKRGSGKSSTRCRSKSRCRKT